MSKISRPPDSRRRRRRADAERSEAAILDAAVHVLAERPEASLEDIAVAAGVTRQTVYAHYASRQLLVRAVVERISDEAIAAIDAADLERGPAAAALVRLLDAGWEAFERSALLQHLSTVQVTPAEEHERHQSVFARLDRLIRRGQRSGEFDRTQPREWLAAATVALGHAAGTEVTAGRMSSRAAAAALRDSVLRVYGVTRVRGAGTRGSAGR